jgi:hypothetical protein
MGRRIYCCACGVDVAARLTDGREVYPHREDLRGLPFWRCDACRNFVGCHHKTKNRTQPLGCIPSPEIKAARQHIHALLDPIWESGSMSRAALYKAISDQVGWTYHTAKIRTISEARDVYRIVRNISRQPLAPLHSEAPPG